MSIQLTFEIELHSDYHVGAGQRVGTLDSALLRDQEQSPVLRGTMLAGLLRDGLCDLMEMLEAHNFSHQHMEKALERLFGSARQRKQWAYSSANVAERLSGNHLRQGSQEVTRVRINPRTRRSAPQQLFSEEEGERGLIFVFTADSPANTPEDQKDAALLVASACMVRHLGAARRRGRGECTFKLTASKGFLDGVEVVQLTDEALKKFKEQWLDQQAGEQEKTHGEESAVSLPLTHTYKRFQLIAYLQEPLLVAKHSEAANAYETLFTVSGTAVLGALATRAAHKLHLHSNSQPPEAFVQLFVRGAARISTLLPAIAPSVGKKGRPFLYPAIAAPRALSQCENYPIYRAEQGEEHPARNGFDTAASVFCTSCGGKMKVVNGFILLQKKKQTYTPSRREEMHIQINRQTNRANEGDLYEYIALEAGQWLVGELHCNEGAWKQLQAWTDLATDKPLSLRLGKATQRGYGLVHFVLEEIESDDFSPFILHPFDKRVTAVSDNTLDVTLLLLTDTILTDFCGRHYVGFDEQWLKEVLAPEAQNITIVKQFTSSHAIDSFHASRRLPRWRDEAIEAGSVARLQIQTNDVEALKKRLQALEKEGVGLRRHEGFGRIAFNHPLLQNTPEFEQTISLSTADGLINLTSGGNILERQARSRREWETTLAQAEWKAINKPEYEALARLLFVNRFLPLEDVKKWLGWDETNNRPQALLQPTNLWGGKDKGLNARDKEPRLSREGLACVREWVEKLEKNQYLDTATGLELLSQRIADEAAKTKGEA